MLNMAAERSEINVLHELFFRSARNFPNNVAVTFSGDAVESITYRELSKKVENLSTCLSKIFSRNEVVAIYSSDCLNLPALLLAVMDASAAFYPISTTLQPRKVLESVNHRSIRYILVDNGLLQNLLNLNEYDHDNTFIRMQLEITDSNSLNEVQFTMLKVTTSNQPCIVNWSKNLAYVMQTSGTTGDPKAVFVPHSCIVPNIFHLSSMFEVTSQDVVYLASPYTFDPSIVQMFLAFYNGAELLITPQVTKLIPETFCQKLFDQHRVTILQPTPSLLYYIGEDLVSRKLLSENSSLSVLAIGGESCPSLSSLRKWKHSKCKTRLYNIYGITEVSSWATCHRITEDELDVTVDDDSNESFNACKLGAPLWQTELIVYDDNRDIVNENGIGHLWIGGKDRQCLLEGETEENVPIMRDSGDIVQIKDSHMWYLGRSDNQIKRFGHRINLDYIEKAVCEYADVTSCTLVLETVSTGGTLLHLFAVPKLLGEKTTGDLERHKATLWKQIKDVLPRPSQPDQVHLVWKLPLTSHGKVDKHEVLKSVHDGYLHCQDDLNVDAALSEMWQDSVAKNLSDITMNKESSLKQSKLDSMMKPFSGRGQIPLVKPDDMFMLQGGDSLRAVQFADQIEKWMRKRCGHPLDLSMLFEIITNKPFSCLVSYVEGTLQSSKLGISNSTELDESANEKSKRSPNTCTDLEPIAKMSKTDNNLANIDKDKPFFENTVSVRDDQMCTCFLRRGSERFACSTCENTPGCVILHHDILSISPIKELPLKWSVCMEKCIDASPLVVPSCLAGEGVVFIGSHSYLFMSVSLSNGEVLWQTRLGGRIESSACLSRCGKLIAVGCYDGKMYVLARNNGKITWTYQTQDVVKSSPCLDLKTGLIWTGSHDGCLYGLDINRKVCKMCVKCKEGSCFSSPAISYDPHYVYIGTLAGCFLCVDAVSGEVKWFKRLGKPIFSTPFIQGDNVFVATVNGCLKCLSHCGDEVWELRTDDRLFSSPVNISFQKAATAGDVVLASHGHKVHRVSSKGKCEWSTSVDGPVYATPCFVFSNYDLTIQETSTPQTLGSNSVCIVVVTTKGTMYLLAASDGRILKTFFLPGEVFSSPVIVGSDIVFGCRNDYLYCVKLM